MLSPQKLHPPVDREPGGDMPAAREDEGNRLTRPSRFVLLKPRLTPATTEPAAGERSRQAEEKVREPETPSPAARHEQRAAFQLLDDVKSFIPKMMQENGLLRQNLLELKAQAEGEIAAAEERALEWKVSADALASQVEVLEAAVVDLKIRLQRSESIVAIEKELASKSSQEAAEAECLSKLFEDKVLSSFGFGSIFQDALTKLDGAEPK